MADRMLRLGVAGLGRGFMLMLPTLTGHPRVTLVAAADPRATARTQFETEFGGATYDSVDALCEDPGVDAIYLATPHAFHAAQVVAAARCGKHVLVEKPMAVTLAECAVMIDAVRRAGVELVVGHSHSFDAPYLRTRSHIAAGTFGALKMIHAFNYTDFLYRPRRPEELDTAQGGGVVFSQGAHQVDVVRLLGGGRVRSVRAHAASWDPARPTEGAYSALLAFEEGAFATLTYSGYAHFDSDELCGWIGETGAAKDPARYGAARALLRTAASPAAEAALKTARTYGAQPATATPVGHNHFGVLIASCAGADLRPVPNGVKVYDDTNAWLDALPPPAVPRAEVIDELCAAVVDGVAPLHSGEWAMATLEACLAILDSSRLSKEVTLVHQVAVPPR